MAIPRKQIGWSQESNLLWEISRQMEKLTGVAYNSGGGGGGTPLITKTKSQIDSLISSNGLVPGQFYKVTGVDVPLYGGTDIIIQAATTNQLALQGHGIFYTPKYDQEMQGFNVWSKNILYTASFGSIFDIGEIVDAKDGSDNIVGTAILRNQGLLEWISGSAADWNNVTYITGQTNTNDAYSFSLINFPTSINPNPGDLTIWGGRVWSNDSGGTGNSIDQFTLDADWNVIPYNTTDYNVSIDVIHYDYEHDLIVSRKDKYDNEVSFTYYQDNPIKAFQWGNGYDNNSGKGVSGCKVSGDSYFECINFRGEWMWDVNVLQESNIFGLTIEGDADANFGYITVSQDSYMNGIISVNCPIQYINVNSGSGIFNLNLNLNNGGFQNIEVINESNIYSIHSEGMAFTYNTISNNSHINDIVSWGGYVSNNTLDQLSYISSNYATFNNGVTIIRNTVNSSEIVDNNLLNGGQITYNTLVNGSAIDGDIIDTDSEISRNILQSASFNNTTLSNSDFTYNTLNSSNLNFGTSIPSSSSIGNLIVNNIGDNINGFDLTSATYIFNISPTKTIFNNAVNISRLSFYDALDTLQIVNCNA
jgi:hypothetical protein